MVNRKVVGGFRSDKGAIKLNPLARLVSCVAHLFHAVNLLSHFDFRYEWIIITSLWVPVYACCQNLFSKF